MFLSILQLDKPNSDVYDDNYISALSANPEKYGYEITGSEIYRGSMELLHWKNDQTDFHSAFKIRDRAQAYMTAHNVPMISAFEYLNFMAHGITTNVPEYLASHKIIETRSTTVATKVRQDYIDKKSEWFKNYHKT